MALKLLVDTCVWLDLARDHREAPTLDALNDLIEANELELIVPQLVLDEFDRCKGRVITDSRRSLQSHLRMVRDAVNRFDEASKAETLRALGEIDHKIVTNGDAANNGVGRVEALLKSVPPIATSCVVKQRVTERAIARMAPYHRGKNSVGDAILIEIYADLLISRKTEPGRFAFVTHNTNDFSEVVGDRRKPHADLANLFTSPDSTYWVSMVNLLHWLDPDLLADHQAEFNYSQQPRGLTEILEAEHLLFRQVWYNRHWNLRCAIEQGTHHVVSENDYSRNPYRNDQTLDTVWAQALEAAMRTEEELGPENLGPWDDFEWGMINGKLSALRWVLGDEWDMLDS